jgi:hypothetical protein
MIAKPALPAMACVYVDDGNFGKYPVAIHTDAQKGRWYEVCLGNGPED